MTVVRHHSFAMIASRTFASFFGPNAETGRDS
jgi:hypothetical protein